MNTSFEKRPSIQTTGKVLIHLTSIREHRHRRKIISSWRRFMVKTGKHTHHLVTVPFLRPLINITRIVLTLWVVFGFEVWESSTESTNRGLGWVPGDETSLVHTSTHRVILLLFQVIPGYLVHVSAYSRIYIWTQKILPWYQLTRGHWVTGTGHWWEQLGRRSR